MKWLLSLSCVLVLCADAYSNPLDAFGFGARSTALGGAVTAKPDDSSANYYNPGALGFAREIRLDIGYALVKPKLYLNERDQLVDASRGAQGGVVLPFQTVGVPMAFSLGVHLPDERISRIRALPEQRPRFVLWDNRPQRLVISSNAAVQVVEGLSIGGGLTYLANTAGTLALDGEVDLFDEDETFLRSGIDVNLSAVRYATLGVNWRPNASWAIGAAWRQSFSLLLDLTVAVEGDIQAGSGNTVVEDGALRLTSFNTNLYSPEQYVFGIGYMPQDWYLSLEVSWVRWSAFPTPTAAVSLDLDLSPLEVTLPVPDLPSPPNFHDIFIPRVGVEHLTWSGEYIGLVSRLGYFYEPSPAPNQPGLTNYVDGDKHGISAGVGLHVQDPSGTFPKTIAIDVAAQMIILPARVYMKDDAADAVGDYTADGYTLGLFTTVGVPL